MQMTGTGARVVVEGLGKRYRNGSTDIVAVDHLDLSIEPNTMVAITGPSGSGKSTLLHLIGAIEKADRGLITVDGTNLDGLRAGALSRYRRTVGFIFQRYHLLPALTALDNVIAPLLPYRTSFNKAARAAELLAAAGLAGRENALPAQLSGGQQQRVAIARALVGEPRLLLADEPTGNLDSRTGTEILDLIEELRAARPMTVLIATHEQHVAARCDRLLRLRDGQVIEDLELTGGEDPGQTMSRVGGIRL
jgi:putative ABC transport system ATP-binding protein